MKKSLLIGLLAAAAAVVMFSGCPTGSDIEYRDVDRPVPYPVPAPIHVDEVVANEGDLIAALDNPDYQVIGVNGGTITLTAALEIPSNKTVQILNGGGLATGTGYGLTVAGKLYVEYGGGLTVASSADPIEVTGAIEVATGGTLTIDDVTTDVTGLGTSKVTINGGTLAITGTVDLDANDIQAAWNSVKKGSLDLSAVTFSPGDPKPSEITSNLSGSGLSAQRTFTIVANGAEDAASLVIPEGLILTTSDDLDSVATLNVSGSLIAAGAILNSGGAALTVGPTGRASIGAATLTSSSVYGALVLNDDLTLDTGAVLGIADPAQVTGAYEIIADAGTITIGIGANDINDIYEGFTTDGTGVTANDLGATLLALLTDRNTLEASINPLGSGFGGGTNLAIGTAAPTSASAVDVTDDMDGGSGGTVSISTGSEFVGTLTVTGATGGPDAASVSAESFALSVTGAGVLQLTDTECVGSDADVYVILTFEDLQIKNSGLISPASMSESFNIGLRTDR